MGIRFSQYLTATEVNLMIKEGFEVSAFVKETFVSVLVNSEHYVQGNYE